MYQGGKKRGRGNNASQDLNVIEVNGQAVPEETIAARRDKGQRIGCGRSNHWWPDCWLNPKNKPKSGKGKGRNNSGKGNAKGNRGKGWKGAGKGGKGANGANSATDQPTSKRAKRQQKIATARENEEDMRAIVMGIDDLVAEKVESHLNASEDQGNDQPPSSTRMVAREIQRNSRRNSTRSSNAGRTMSSTSEARAALARMSERFSSQN